MTVRHEAEQLHKRSYEERLTVIVGQRNSKPVVILVAVIILVLSLLYFARRGDQGQPPDSTPLHEENY